MSSPSRSPLPPPSPPAPSRSSQSTRSERLSHASNLYPLLFYFSELNNFHRVYLGNSSDTKPLSIVTVWQDAVAHHTLLKKKNCLFIWLCQVLIVPCEPLVMVCNIWFPDQGLNPGPLHWEHRVSHWDTKEVAHPTLLSLGLFHRYLLAFCSVEVTCEAWNRSILPRDRTSSGLQSSIAHSHYLFKTMYQEKTNNVIRSFPSSSSTKQGRRG